MVVDSSALVAVLPREPEAEAFTAAMLAAPRRLVGAPSYLETAMVLVGRLGPAAHGAADRLLAAVGAEIVPFTPDQARRAVEAFLAHRQHPCGNLR